MSLYNKSGSRQQQNPVVTNRNGDVLTPDDAPTISFPTLLPQSPSNDVGSLGSPWRDGHFSGQVKGTSAAIVGSLTAGTVTASQFIGGLIPASDLLPLTTAQYNIGSAVNTWNNIYWSGIAFGGGLSLSAQATVRDILPATTALYSIGSNATRFQDGFFNGTVSTGTCTASLFNIADGFTVRIGDANTSPADSGAVAIGASAGKNFAGSLAASTSTAVGYQALYTTAGANNTGVGCAAGYNIGPGAFDNIALGYNACMGNDSGFSGSYNVGISRNSNRSLTTGSENIAIGFNAGQQNTTGIGSVMIGRNAGATNTVLTQCIAIGSSALQAGATSLSNNVAIGGSALTSCTASNVVAVGFEAGKNQANGPQNTYIGYQCGTGAAANTATANTGLGYQTLTAITTGASNVALGAFAGTALTSGANNVLCGYQAGLLLATATEHVAIGTAALATMTDTTTNACVAIGANALEKLVNAAGTAIGYRAGRYATGSGNVYVGVNAGLGVDTQSTGVNNTAVGGNSLSGVTTGGQNVAIGDAAGSGLTTGLRNVLIGQNTGTSLVSGNDNVIIGQNVTMANSTTGSGNVIVGAANSTTALQVKSIAVGSSNTIAHGGCIVLACGLTTLVANRLYLGSATSQLSTTSSAATGGATALPAQPATYLIAYVNGTQYKIPLYNP